MTKSYYHATDMANLDSIMEKGLLKNKYEGIIYLTDDPIDAVKFLPLRGVKNILVIEVGIKEELVEEQFDHNETFFKCKAYGYPDGIPSDEFIELRKWEL